MARRSIAGAVLVATVVALVVLVGGGDEDRRRQVSCVDYRFPSTAWKASRGSMAADAVRLREQAQDDLLRCRVLEGRTRASVRSLLGAPRGDSSTGWTYDIGPGEGIDAGATSILLLEFDRGRVSEVSPAVR